MTNEERDKLIDDYAWRCVDDMELDDLCRAVAQQIADRFENKSQDYLIKEVKQCYPDLLNANDNTN